MRAEPAAQVRAPRPLAPWRQVPLELAPREPLAQLVAVVVVQELEL